MPDTWLVRWVNDNDDSSGSLSSQLQCRHVYISTCGKELILSSPVIPTLFLDECSSFTACFLLVLI